MSVIHQHSALATSQANKNIHDIAVAVSMLLPAAGLVWGFYLFCVLFHDFPFLIAAAVIAYLTRRYAMMSGISVIYHRWATHNSFQPKEWLAFIIGIQGCMTLQGTLIKWVVDHWIHHERADHDGDPHSPYDRRWMSLWRRFWHAHFLWFYWLFNPERRTPDKHRDEMTADFLKNRVIRVLSNPVIYFTCVVVGVLTPSFFVGGVAGAIYGSGMFWTGFWVGFLWGGLVAIFDVNHSTYCVNSVCHLWGYTNFNNPLDHSVNNWFVAWLTHGEGFHGNHHAKPHSANHGMTIKEKLLDHSAWQIGFFQELGWTTQVEFTDERDFDLIQKVLDRKAKDAGLLPATVSAP